ncbi:MAG: hypothetical protein LBB94_08005 [Clostridiales bacterium]|nr:hypothetical protein [Clostridiales bacterium]
MRVLQIPRPKGGEVLLKIMAASVNAYDWHLLRAKPFFTRFMSGVFKPNGICMVIGFSTIGNMIRVAFAGKRDGKTN